MIDKKNQPSLVIAGVLSNQIMDGERINQIKSVYPLDDIVSQLIKAGTERRLVVTNKNKAKEIFDSIGVQPAKQSNIFNLVKNSISHPAAEVNKESRKFSTPEEV